MVQKYRDGRKKRSLVGEEIFEEFSTMFWLKPGMFLEKNFREIGFKPKVSHY
jgi:hypothetical protein